MNREGIEPIQDILFRMNVRYLTVRPNGLQLQPATRPLRAVRARILNHGGARTLYRRRRPICRSLDGLRALADADKRCASCPDRDGCTSQVRIDLLVNSRPYRLLLAFTSANNFLLFAAEWLARQQDLRKVQIRIDVVDRGSWGELRFSQARGVSNCA